MSTRPGRTPARCTPPRLAQGRSFDSRFVAVTFPLRDSVKQRGRGLARRGKWLHGGSPPVENHAASRPARLDRRRFLARWAPAERFFEAAWHGGCQPTMAEPIPSGPGVAQPPANARVRRGEMSRKGKLGRKRRMGREGEMAAPQKPDHGNRGTARARCRALPARSLQVAPLDSLQGRASRDILDTRERDHARELRPRKLRADLSR